METKQLVFFLTFASMCLLSCVTTAPPGRVKARIADKKKYFATCRDRDGGNSFSVRQKGKDLLAARMDWVVDSKRGLNLEVSNSIGAVMGTLQTKVSSIKVEGLSKDFSIDVDEEGFIRLKGHPIGLKVKELPCILSFALPSEWYNKSAANKSHKGKEGFGFSDHRRTVSWRVEKATGGTRVCSRVEWSNFWIFSYSHADWCYTLTSGGRSGEFTIDDEFHLQWEEDHEQAQQSSRS